MSETKIQWTATPLPDGTMLPGFTMNPWIGCDKVSAGCKNCYASVDTFARVSRGRGLELWGPKAARHVTSDANWRKPLAWNREAAKSGVRRKVFCASLADVFEDRPDLAAPRARLFALIGATPNLDWLLLTKRPENADRLWTTAQIDSFNGADSLGAVWLPNVWLGTTVEDQQRADERIPHLLRVPAKIRFLSCEPLLEAVDLTRWLRGCDPIVLDARGPICKACALRADIGASLDARIDWTIFGGESGPGARPFDLAWARSLVRQCRDAGVAGFFKQAGTHAIDTGERLRLRDSHGGDLAELPIDLHVREFPRVS